MNELDSDYKPFIFKSKEGRCALMEAAARCHVKCCHLILNKISAKKKTLRKVLRMRDDSDKTALTLAIDAVDIKPYKRDKCAKLILRHYDLKEDSEDIFLHVYNYLILIWHKKYGIILVTDLIYNRDCYKLPIKMNIMRFYFCKNGNYTCLEWLLSLSEENERKNQDDDNLSQKHETSKMTPLILIVCNDDRKKPRHKHQKGLTKQEKENYYKCAKLIFERIKKPRDLIFEVDDTHKNALQYACLNGNLSTATLILSQLTEKSQRQIVESRDESGYNCFNFAIQGGNLELIETIYEIFKFHDKERQLMEDSNCLMLALQNGYEDVTEWLLFTFMRDTKIKLKYLNRNISSSRDSKKFESKIKKWITKILDKEVNRIGDVRDIVHIFKWLLNINPLIKFVSN